MNGPQHYAEAERLQELAETHDWYGTADDLARVQVVLAAARLHARLAHVAATVDAAYDPLGRSLAHDHDGWRAVLE